MFVINGAEKGLDIGLLRNVVHFLKNLGYGIALDDLRMPIRETFFMKCSLSLADSIGSEYFRNACIVNAIGTRNNSSSTTPRYGAGTYVAMMTPVPVVTESIRRRRTFEMPPGNKRRPFPRINGWICSTYSSIKFRRISD